jgi:excinuclease UvrABC nuclease subunit
MAEERSIVEAYDISVEEILANKQAINPKITGVYFLIKGSEIVYVGQSVDIMNRIAQHSKDVLKDFDSFSILECPTELLLTIEAHLIYKFRPRLNTSLPVNNLYKSFQQIKKIHDINAVILKVWMKYKAIEMDKDGLYCLRDFDGINDFKDWMRRKHPNIYLRQCSVHYLRRYIQEVSASDGGAG